MNDKKKMDRKKVIQIAIGVVVAAAIIGATISSAQAYSIQKGQTKSYFVAPVGSLPVYWYTDGSSPTFLDARVSWWQYWRNEQCPQATIDIYAGSGGGTWYWIHQMDLKEWGRSSPPLWLTGGVYKFEIRSERLAQVTLRVR